MFFICCMNFKDLILLKITFVLHTGEVFRFWLCEMNEIDPVIIDLFKRYFNFINHYEKQIVLQNVKISRSYIFWMNIEWKVT